MAQIIQQFPTTWEQQAMARRLRNRKLLYISLGGAAVIAVVTFVIYQKRKKDKATTGQSAYDVLMNGSKTTVIDPPTGNTAKGSNSTTNSSAQLPPVTKPAPETDGLPINVGSKNKYVGQLQYALNDLYSAGLSTDSIFGPKTKAALDKQSIRLPLDESAYYDIVDKYLANAGKKLLTYGRVGNYAECKKILSSLILPYDYIAVSNVFKKENFIDGVPMTLVTGMLRKFTTGTQQKEIEDQFKRMGLIKDSDGKWKILGGLTGPSKFNVITIADTVVTLPDNTRIPIEKAVMIGRMTAIDASYVYLENNGQQMKVPWESVKVLA